nr:hypothetical protein CFP56_11881 [Quercus suber]
MSVRPGSDSRCVGQPPELPVVWERVQPRSGRWRSAAGVIALRARRVDRRWRMSTPRLWSRRRSRRAEIGAAGSCGDRGSQARMGPGIRGGWRADFGVAAGSWRMRCKFLGSGGGIQVPRRVNQAAPERDAVGRRSKVVGLLEGV